MQRSGGVFSSENKLLVIWRLCAARAEMPNHMAEWDSCQDSVVQEIQARVQHTSRDGSGSTKSYVMS